MDSEWISSAFGLAGVLVGGVITARSSTQQARRAARAEALDLFEDIRPLWSQVARPTSSSFEDLDREHRKLSKLLLLAGVPIAITTDYRFASRNSLGWVEDEGAEPHEVNSYVFALDDLILGYLQSPWRAAFTRRSFRMWRLRRSAYPFSGHAPAI